MYGIPRATFDLNILIEATPKNAQKLPDAFLEANLGTASLITADQILLNEITVFQDRVRIDVQTSTPRIDFENAWKNGQKMKYQQQDFFVTSKDDLIASKLASGREVDRYDYDIKLLQSLDNNSRD